MASVDRLVILIDMASGPICSHTIPILSYSNRLKYTILIVSEFVFHEILAGAPALRCAPESTVHFTFVGAGLENIWFVGYAVWDIY